MINSPYALLPRVDVFASRVLGFSGEAISSTAGGIASDKEQERPPKKLSLRAVFAKQSPSLAWEIASGAKASPSQ